MGRANSVRRYHHLAVYAGMQAMTATDPEALPGWPHERLRKIDSDYYEKRILAYWESRCRRAVKRLKGAREEVEHWGGYASEYFKDKWNLAGDLKATDDVLAAIGPLPDQEPK